MCLAVPALVVAIEADLTATVDLSGVSRTVAVHGSVPGRAKWAAFSYLSREVKKRGNA